MVHAVIGDVVQRFILRYHIAKLSNGSRNGLRENQDGVCISNGVTSSPEVASVVVKRNLPGKNLKRYEIGKI
jgi:hypothetical protein